MDRFPQLDYEKPENGVGFRATVPLLNGNAAACARILQLFDAVRAAEVIPMIFVTKQILRERGRIYDETRLLRADIGDATTAKIYCRNGPATPN